jgi:calcium permeable stress-gated cation channel
VIAASGLAVASAPDVSQYISFLRMIADHDNLGSALLMTIVPGVAATLFIAVALAIITCELLSSFEETRAF